MNKDLLLQLADHLDSVNETKGALHECVKLWPDKWCIVDSKPVLMNKTFTIQDNASILSACTFFCLHYYEALLLFPSDQVSPAETAEEIRKFCK